MARWKKGKDGWDMNCRSRQSLILGIGPKVIFIGSGLGYRVRYPEASVEDRRWILFKRSLLGMAFGLFCCHLYLQS